MKKLLLGLGLLLSLAAPATAQNTTCSDRPAGDVSNACANTRFVQSTTGGLAVGTSPIAGGVDKSILYDNAGILGNIITSTAGAANQIQNLFGGQFVGVPVNAYGALNDSVTNSTRYIVTAAAYANTNRMGLVFNSGGNYQITPMQFGGSYQNSGTFSGTISGTTLTAVTTPIGIQLSIGQSITCGTCTADTVITALGTNASGFIGTYTVNTAQTVGASFTGSGSGTNLTTTAVTGTIAAGDVVNGPGVPTGTTIVSQTSGPVGGAGVYVTSLATTSSSAALTTNKTITASAPSFTASISGTTMTASAVTGRITLVDSLVGGSTISGTTVVAQLTGATGQAGNYTISYSQAVGSTSFRSYPYTVAAIPNGLYGAVGGETATTIVATGSAATKSALIKIVNPPALGAVLGFEMANLRLTASSLYGNALMLHGFSATSSGGQPSLRNLTLSNAIGTNCGFAMIGNAPNNAPWGIIEAKFSMISTYGNTVCDVNIDGNNGDGSHNIQAVYMDRVSANSASTGPGFKVDYSEVTCIECLSQNHGGVPIAFNNIYHNVWTNFYSEADVGAISSTANTFGLHMNGTVVSGVDANLLTCSTCDIDIHIGAGLGTWPTNTQRNIGAAVGQSITLKGLATAPGSPSASTGVAGASSAAGLQLMGSGTIYDVTLYNKSATNVCGVLTGTTQFDCTAFSVGTKTITLGGNFATSGAFNLTATLTGNTNVTFPTSGTLATTSGSSIPSVAIGDLLYGSGVNTLSTLADVATGNALISGGVGVAPAWGKIALAAAVSGTLPLANGGTAAALTASNGGIFYSTGSAGAILSGTATARQMLQSGASATPAWSTTTWPATTTINRILYSSSASVIGEITSANSSILVTDSGGIPSLSTTLPAYTLGGTISGGGNQINNVVIGTTTPLAGTFTTVAASTSISSPIHTATGTLTFQSNGSTFGGTLTSSQWFLGSTSLTPASGTTLTVNQNTGGTPLTSAFGNIVGQFISADTASNVVTFDSFGAGTVLASRSSSGTQAAKTALVGGGGSLTFGATAWDGTAYGTGGAIDFNATATLWSGTNHGMYFRVRTVLDGATALTERIRITDGLCVGCTTSPGAGLISINSATYLMRNGTAWTNGAGASAGTITNAPAAGNPTKWIPVDDNGTTRYIPTW